MQKHSQAGFTFLELVIAVLILGVLMGIAIPAYWAFADRAKRSATKSTLANIKQAINLYQNDTGKYPKRLDDLVHRPSGDEGKKWEGPYLQKSPRDGWNREFYYKVTPGGKHPYELYSYGKEGESGPEEGYIDAWESL